MTNTAADRSNAVPAVDPPSEGSGAPSAPEPGLASSPEPPAGLDEAGRRSVARLVDDVLPELNSWAARYPEVMNRSGTLRDRMVWTCMSTALTCPEASRQVRFEQIALMVAVFALDDVLDGAAPDCSYEDLRELGNRCRPIFASASPSPASEPLRADLEAVVTMLEDCAGRLAHHPAPSWLHRRLERSWEQFIDASLQEARWRLGLDPWPDLDGYMRNAVHSVGTTPCFTAFAITCHPVAVESCTVTPYDQVLDHVAEACRLSNDLGGAEREAEEGTPNAVALLLRGGHDRAQIDTALGQRITKALQHMDAAAHNVPEGLEPATLHACRSAHFAYQWYQADDSYGMPLERLLQLLSQPTDSPSHLEVDSGDRAQPVDDG